MDRAQKIEELVDDELDCIISDPDVARENFKELLMEGFKGYRNMSDDEVDEAYHQMCISQEGQEHA